MIRSLFRRRRTYLMGVLALLVAGPAFAFLQFLPLNTWQAAVPLGLPPAYNLQVVVSPGLYGDQIVGIETGRDVRSPFTAITVLFGAANPVGAALTPYTQNIPGFPGVSTPGFPMATPYPAPVPPAFYLRLVYRAINDPANPGWGPPLPGAVNQLDSSVQTCLAVAAEFAAFRAAAQTAAGVGTPAPFPASVPAQLYMEVNPNGGAVNMEFYTYQVIR